MGQLLTRNPERWFALEKAVEEGWSFNRIRKELGIQYYTVKQWYHGYKPFKVGGGSHLKAKYRKMREEEEK